MRRWFSLALALAMCFTMVMGEAAFAFAEDEAVLEMVETEVPQDGDAELTDTEPEEDAQPEPGDGDDASNEEITDDTSESVDTDADQQPAEAPEEVDETGDTEDFELWYARTNASLTLEMDDAVGRTVPAGCVLLVVGEAGEGLLRVMCENLSGAVDASALERLTDDEVQQFMDELTALEAVALYQDLLDYPLPPEPVVEPAQDEVEVSNDQPEEQVDTSEDQNDGASEETPIIDDIDEVAEETGDIVESPDDKTISNTEDVETVEDAQSVETPEVEDEPVEEVVSDAIENEENTENIAAPVNQENEVTDTPEDIAAPDNQENNDAENPEQTPDADTPVITNDDQIKEPVEEDQTREPKETEAPEKTAETAETEEPAKAETEAPAQADDPGDAEVEPAVEMVEEALYLAEPEYEDKAEAAVEVGAPASIAFNLNRVTLGLKESFTGLTATVVDANGTPVEGQMVAWRSSNKRVVRVDQTGKLVAVKRGKATIYASAEGLPEAAVSVVVKKAPTKLTAKPKNINISIGMTAQITGKVDSGAASGKLTYVSSDPSVAVVDENGLVTGIGPGMATITMRTFNKKKARCIVSVFDTPASIVTEKPSYAILVGATQSIAATILDQSGNPTYANLSIASSNPECVAAVDGGTIMGVSLGSATLTITTHNGLTTTCDVDVCGNAADMTLSASTITIGVKEKYNRMTYTLTPPEGQDKCAAIVTWRSNNKKIAKVNASTGVITGVKAGTTTVVATTNNGISRKVKVVVKKAPSSVTLSHREMLLTIGMQERLVASYNGKHENDNITYTSSNPDIVTVDADGLVTAVGDGAATITAETYNGKQAVCSVTVSGEPEQVIMTSAITMPVGMTEQLDYSALDISGQPSSANFTFTAISETGSVEVDNEGRVTAVSEGTARVKVQTHNGVTTHIDENGNLVETECVITIVEAPAEIRIVASSTMVVGDTCEVSARLYKADGNFTSNGTYELSVSGSCVTLDESNTLKAVAAGTATITATAYNGISATFKVTVTRRYRMYAAYSYFNVVEKGSLTFPKNNATSFQEVLSKAQIGGIVKYENLGILENPSKKKLLNGISSAFADSLDSDVSVVYLCSHGYNYVDIPKNSGSTHYGLQLPGYEDYNSSSNYYITSEEIFDAISAIKGQVILVLDSCYSGQFIVNMKSKLNDVGGRISVMTAATNTLACYYNVSDTDKACDFFTLYLLMGAGYDMRTHVNNGTMPADTNNDGKLTFNEMFSYAKSNVTANMPKFEGKSWFHGDANQVPYVYKGNNGDLVLYEYAS